MFVSMGEPERRRRRLRASSSAAPPAAPPVTDPVTVARMTSAPPADATGDRPDEAAGGQPDEATGSRPDEAAGERPDGPTGDAAAGGDAADEPTGPGSPRRSRPASGAPFDDREAERGLRGLVGSGSSQVSVGAALRARDATRPTEAQLADAEQNLTIVRRNWTPREDLPRR